MESLDDVLVPVELKYCERCGGLWFRSKEDAEIYCPACAEQMAELPQRVLVVAVDSIDELEAYLAELSGMCGKGGNA
jgi:NADH pyrophosphatase NudC (nudix superfamily)